jgi:hypothetical protein
MTERRDDERRRTTRVAVDIAANDTTHSTRLRARDLSLGGGCFASKRSYAVGSALDVELSLPGSESPVRLSAAVAATSPETVHLRFVKPGRAALVRLAETLF